MKYFVICEKSATGWGAYAPDLPGLGVAAMTLEETKELIRDAIDFHLEGTRENGDPLRFRVRPPNTRESNIPTLKFSH